MAETVTMIRTFDLKINTEHEKCFIWMKKITLVWYCQRQQPPRCIYTSRDIESMMIFKCCIKKCCSLFFIYFEMNFRDWRLFMTSAVVVVLNFFKNISSLKHPLWFFLFYYLKLVTKHIILIVVVSNMNLNLCDMCNSLWIIK